MDVLDWVTTTADQIPGPLRAGIAALFACLEVLGLGPFLPGELAVLFLGASFDDVPGALLLVAAVTLGASAGDHALYSTGRTMGPRLRNGWLVRTIGVEKWDVAIGTVERRGAWAVTSTRLVPIVRSLTPIAAGISGMPRSRFLVASLVGSFTWAIVWGGTGFLLRSSLALAERLVGQSTGIIIAAFATGVLAASAFWVIGKHRRAALPISPGPWTGRSITTSVEVLALSAFVVAVSFSAAGSDAPWTGAFAVCAALGWAGVLSLPHAPSISTSGLRGSLVRLAVGTLAACTLVVVHALPISLGCMILGSLFAAELTRPPGAMLQVTERVVFAALFAGLALEAAPFVWSGSAVGSLVSLLLFGATIAALLIAHRNVGSSVRVALLRNA